MEKNKLFIMLLDKADMNLDECINVLYDFGKIRKCDKMHTYNGYRKINEAIDTVFHESIDDFQFNLINCISERLNYYRMVVGYEAMSNLFLEKSETEHEVRRRKISQDKSQNEIQKKNKEEFEKSREERKKDEQSPVAKAIRAKGDNQTEAADKLDVHKSTISRIKTGARKPSFDTLQDLSKVYGGSLVNQLLGRDIS